MKNQNKRVNLSIHLHGNDVYCSSGTDDGLILNDEVTSTIAESANNYEIKENLNINFKANEKSCINEEDFMLAYYNTFVSKMNQKKHELKRCLTTGVILLCVGILVLLFDIFVANQFSDFWYEFFNVFAWVFCWGGIEVLTIEMIQIQIEINKLKRLINSHIFFTVGCSNKDIK